MIIKVLILFLNVFKIITSLLIYTVYVLDSVCSSSPAAKMGLSLRTQFLCCSVRHRNPLQNIQETLPRKRKGKEEKKEKQPHSPPWACPFFPLTGTITQQNDQKRQCSVYLRINFGKKPFSDHSSSSPSHYPLTSRLKQDSNSRHLFNFCIGNMGKYIIKNLLFVDYDHEGNMTETWALPSDLSFALSSIPVLSHPPHHQLALEEVLGKSTAAKNLHL